MSPQVNPYLSCGGAAAEAMASYATVLGGTPEVTTFSMGGWPDPAMADR